MLKGLSNLSLKQIHDRSRSSIFNPGVAFSQECFEGAPLPYKTIEFLKTWSLPEESNATGIGGFKIHSKSNPNYGTVQWFPTLAEWEWLSEFKTPFPENLAHERVFGTGDGAKLGPSNTILGPSDGEGGPICIKSDGTLVYYPENDGYQEYAVNSDVEKLLYCIVFFQTMAALSRRKTKKDPIHVHSVRPDYCDTIYEEMRAIDPKAIESPLSFWPLMLDLACFKHPLANGRRRYNVGR